MRKKIDTNEEYLDYFQNIDQKNDPVLEAFKIALDTRKFEIDLYWRRANYFWLFIGAVFVGYCSTLKDSSLEVENILITFLGYIFSVCWLCVNRGSKFWQENWEGNITRLSDKLGYPIFRMIACGKYNAWSIRGKYPYSVSKVNQFLNSVVMLFWAILVIYRTFLISNTDCLCHDQCLFWPLVSFISLVALFFIIHFFSKSFVCKAKDSLGSDTELFFN